jgi:hypothetical protein
MQSIDLGPDPPDAIHDAFMRTLHLAPSHNAFYVHQTGGIAGVNIIYGPVSLRGRCRAPTQSAAYQFNQADATSRLDSGVRPLQPDRHKIGISPCSKYLLKVRCAGCCWLHFATV